MRECGFSEDYVLWELPLSKGHAYRHALMRSLGIETYYFETDDQKLEAGHELLRKLSQLEVDEL